MEIIDKNKPYNQLPFISQLLIDPSPELNALAEETHVALSVLNYAISRLPNDTIILDNLLLQEAKCSSEVENIVTTNDELYTGIALQNLSPAAKEVANYRRGLFAGHERLQHRQLLSVSDIVSINENFNNREKGIRQNMPELEGSLTRIASCLPDGTMDILYTPPHGQKIILDQLLDLLEFIYDDERYPLHPLIKIALAHYQFECIHPFHDGNGRTGRILNILFLCNKNYLKKPYLYASSFIIKNKNEYYDLLYTTTLKQHYDGFINYLLRSFCETAHATLTLVEKIEELHKIYTSQEFLKELSGNKEVLRTIINAAFAKVYVRVQDFSEGEAGIHRQTAATALKNLAEAGLFEVEEVGKTKIYKNIELLNLFGGKQNDCK